ncbi:hypothetical protein M422DRAFT_253240 [Sphaerobolus stellatus SS14]|uniref:Unplaced genomic scaffold SPHSTscaffold_48, whole genome shotgun sequence n=1 Tax=Sphaerobolus stellatus (strain SS14) TaxID=990650 RepID=A0A0C9UK05_SPHS4|nr:hypothetical protein M422DRAFT_253240 [Sphaerobolus stellatus SS14]
MPVFTKFPDGDSLAPSYDTTFDELAPPISSEESTTVFYPIYPPEAVARQTHVICPSILNMQHACNAPVLGPWTICFLNPFIISRPSPWIITPTPLRILAYQTNDRLARQPSYTFTQFQRDLVLYDIQWRVAYGISRPETSVARRAVVDLITLYKPPGAYQPPSIRKIVRFPSLMSSTIRASIMQTFFNNDPPWYAHVDLLFDIKHARSTTTWFTLNAEPRGALNCDNHTIAISVVYGVSKALHSYLVLLWRTGAEILVRNRRRGGTS